MRLHLLTERARAVCKFHRDILNQWNATDPQNRISFPDTRRPLYTVQALEDALKYRFELLLSRTDERSNDLNYPGPLRHMDPLGDAWNRFIAFAWFMGLPLDLGQPMGANHVQEQPSDLPAIKQQDSSSFLEKQTERLQTTSPAQDINPPDLVQCTENETDSQPTVETRRLDHSLAAGLITLICQQRSLAKVENDEVLRVLYPGVSPKCEEAPETLQKLAEDEKEKRCLLCYLVRHAPGQPSFSQAREFTKAVMGTGVGAKKVKDFAAKKKLQPWKQESKSVNRNDAFEELIKQLRLKRQSEIPQV